MMDLLAFIFGLVAVASLTVNGFFVGVTMSEEPKGVHPETVKQNRRIKGNSKRIDKLERENTWLRQQLERQGVLDLKTPITSADDTDADLHIQSLSEQVKGLRKRR